MGTPLKRAPVFFTLLQVRFNTILQLDEYVGPVQERLRRAGYPSFVERQTIAINLAAVSGQQPSAPQPVVEKRYCFGTVDQRHAFILNNDSLLFQSTAYGNFEAFSERFVQGLQTVHEVINLAYIDRVGLRYLDHIFPKPGEPLEQYLKSEMLGLRSALGGELMHAFSETACTIDNVLVRARALTQDGPLAFPPDIKPEGMLLDERFTSAVGLHALLDSDGSTGRRDVFDIDVVRKDINDVHEGVRKVFRAAVTDHALAVWDE
jgi:uncharacterized protein (TIGR04255 family)